MRTTPPFLFPTPSASQTYSLVSHQTRQQIVLSVDYIGGEGRGNKYENIPENKA